VARTCVFSQEGDIKVTGAFSQLYSLHPVEASKIAKEETFAPIKRPLQGNTQISHISMPVSTAQ
jgi:hypothetical protein